MGSPFGPGIWSISHTWNAAEERTGIMILILPLLQPCPALTWGHYVIWFGRIYFHGRKPLLTPSLPVYTGLGAALSWPSGLTDSNEDAKGEVRLFALVRAKAYVRERKEVESRRRSPSAAS